MRVALSKPLIYLGDTVLDQRQVMLKSVFSPPPVKTYQMCQLKKIK